MSETSNSRSEMLSQRRGRGGANKHKPYVEVKVVDIFGNDTITIVDVSVGVNGGKK